MAFKILSKKNWKSTEFIGWFSIGIDNRFGGVDWGSVKDWGYMND